MDESLLKVEEVANRLRLGKTKTHELVLRGDLRAVRIGRSVRVPTSEVDRFIAELTADRGNR